MLWSVIPGKRASRRRKWRPELRRPVRAEGATWGCSNTGHDLATREDTQAGTFGIMGKGPEKVCTEAWERLRGGDQSNRKRPKRNTSGQSRERNGVRMGQRTASKTAGWHPMRTEMGSRVWGSGSGGTPERAGQQQEWTTGAGSPAAGYLLPLTPPTGLPCMTGSR